MLFVDRFEIGEIEEFVDISLSNFNNLHTKSGYLAVSLC